MRTALSRVLLWATPLVGILLTKVTAPYGRHQRDGWGPTWSSRRGWLVMEIPALALFLTALWLGCDHELAQASLVLAAMWCWHYGYRSLLYPLQLKNRAHAIPALVALLGAAFNICNASLNGLWVAQLSPAEAGWDWLLSQGRPLGIAIFFAGSTLHRWSDRRLLELRRRHPDRYSLPRGGAFEWVSCPNYLGEILQWWGWALCCQSLPALAFAAFTVANLAPRAAAHHRWYQQNFSELPSHRRALIPWLW